MGDFLLCFGLFSRFSWVPLLEVQGGKNTWKIVKDVAEPEINAAKALGLI